MSKVQKTTTQVRPLLIALAVIAVAVVSIMFFNRGNGNTSKAEAVYASESATVINITDAVFQQTIADGIVLVDFWATWCPPCRIQNPIIEELAAEIGDKAKITKLDVDHNPGSANQYQVQSIPTLILFKDGKPVKRYVGVQQKATLKAAIEELL